MHAVGQIRVAPGGRIVQNSVKPVDPEAILARGGYQPGKDGVQVLRPATVALMSVNAMGDVSCRPLNSTMRSLA